MATTPNLDPGVLLTSTEEFVAQLVNRPTWQQYGAYRNFELLIDWFAPGTDVRNVEAARRTCSTCPVQSACEAFALADPSLQGMWAGMTDRDRVRRRKELRQAS